MPGPKNPGRLIAGGVIVRPQFEEAEREDGRRAKVYGHSMVCACC